MRRIEFIELLKNYKGNAGIEIVIDSKPYDIEICHDKKTNGKNLISFFAKGYHPTPSKTDDLGRKLKIAEEALKKSREDINWMLNSQKFLNPFVFDYIDKALKQIKGES